MFVNKGNGGGDRLLEQDEGKLLDQYIEGFSCSRSERLAGKNRR